MSSTTATRCSIRCTISAGIPTCTTPASNALEHYNAFGWHEGRDPNAFFDTSGYLAVNKDVAASGMNPLDHYHQIGWHEGRDPSAAFDTTLYLIHNPDVAAAGVDPLAHFLAVRLGRGPRGLRGGRSRPSAASTLNTICCTIPTWRRPASIRCAHFKCRLA